MRTRAALRLLERMTLRPGEIDAAFVKALERDGLDEVAIRAAANVGFHYNLINRITDALDFGLPSPEQTRKLARMLNLAGKVLRGTPDRGDWTRSSDGIVRPPEVDRGREHLLSTPAELSTELRRAIEAFSALQRGGRRAPVADVPDVLAPYVKKVAVAAYKVVEEDVAALRAAGYSTDAVYEVTIAASLGAALVGIEAVFGALYAHRG